MNKKAIFNACLVLAAALACRTAQGMIPPTATPEPALTITSTHAAVPSVTPTITLTPTPSNPPAEVASLRWEQLADGTGFAPIVVNALAIDPANPSNIFAGTYGAGIYISHDSGESWESSSTGLGKGTVGTIAIDPRNPDTVYAALFDQGGIYKSTDGGRTWRAINKGISPADGWNWTGFVYLDPSDSQRVYYSGSTSLYFSANAGRSWSLIPTDCPFVTGLAIDPANSDHLLAASYGQSGQCLAGIYETFVNGKAWKRLTSADMLSSPSGDWWHMAVDPRDFKTIYAGGQKKTYRSTDGGQTWTQIRTCGMSWLAVTEDGTLYCSNGGSGVFYSPDGGTTWGNFSLGPVRGNRWENFAFAQVPGTQTVYIGADAVFRSTDGRRDWKRLAPLEAAARMRIAIDPRQKGNLFLTGLDKESSDYHSTDGGVHWKPMTSPVGGYGAWMTFDPTRNIIYRPGLSSYDGLYRSFDNGTTWSRFGGDFQIHGAWKILADPGNPDRLWLLGECSTRLAVSNDNGRTFETVRGFAWNLCQPVFDMDSTGQRLYVITYEAIRSTDGGENWESVANLPGGSFRAIEIDPSNADTVYIGSVNQGILKTTDGGLSWQEVTVNMPGRSVGDIAIDPSHPQTVYAATDSGLFVSLDGGKWWWPVTQGLGPNPIVYSVAVDPSNPENVYVVTPDGVYRLVR